MDGQDEKLKVEDWGWFKSGNRFSPVLTKKLPLKHSWKSLNAIAKQVALVNT